MPDEKEYAILKALEGEAYWQPSPNDGTRVTLKITDKNFTKPGFHSGMHHMAPGSKIPKHHHEDAVEFIFIHQGHPDVVINGESHQLEAGDSLCIGMNVDHELENNTDKIVILVWAISPPGGLSNYFRHIGKPLAGPDESAPKPFSAERTDNAKVSGD